VVGVGIPQELLEHLLRIRDPLVAHDELEVARPHLIGQGSRVGRDRRSHVDARERLADALILPVISGE
jgi:hypothetical protein